MMDSARLKEKLNAIESRLSKIERQLNIPAPVSAPPVSSDDWEVTVPVVPPLPLSAPKKSEDKPGNWLGIVAILCFVLAAGFIIKLSIDSGWLTPSRQIGISTLLGLSLIGAGFAFLRTDRAYASYLPGGGIIILYLSAFAAHKFYDLISFEMAISATSLISGLCVWLYTQIRHDIYPVTAAVGAYLSPLVLGMNTGTEFTLYYYILCSVAFSVISIWVRSRLLTQISAYLAILMTASVGNRLGADAFVASMLALQFFIFTIGTYLYSRHSKTPLTETEGWSFLPVLLIFYVMEYDFIQRINPDIAPWISLGFAAFLLGVYLTAKRYFADNLGSLTIVMAFATVAFFHSAYLELMPFDLRAWLFPAILIGVMLAPASLFTRAQNKAYLIPALAVLAVLGIEYVSMIFHLLESNNSSWLAVSLVSLGTIWAVIVLSQEKVKTHPQSGNILLAAAHLMAVTGLYRLAYDAGSLAVSACWLLYAVGVMVFAFGRKDNIMAKSALFVLAFAAGKALLYDAANAPTIVRIVCLLLTGAVLYGCGMLMRKIAAWKQSGS